jgi:Sigma-70, region 4
MQSRKARREEPLEVPLPDPILSAEDGVGPEQQALLADSVGLARLVVLDTLAPAERLAFVLHDMFDVPFDEIAPIVGRSPDAARQLTSRARRRIKGAAPVPDADLSRQREVVEAFLTAARDGDFDGLVAVLDPDVVLRADAGVVPAGASRVVRGAGAVAQQALLFAGLGPMARPALVNGAAGILAAPGGLLAAVLGFTVARGRLSRSTSSPTSNACHGSTWRSGRTDERVDPIPSRPSRRKQVRIHSLAIGGLLVRHRPGGWRTSGIRPISWCCSGPGSCWARAPCSCRAARCSRNGPMPELSSFTPGRSFPT